MSLFSLYPNAPVAPETSWDRWAPYLVSDSSDSSDSARDAAGDSAHPPELRAPRAADFPTLRIRGEVAIVGVCTALPTALFQASGAVGGAQLERLESLLRELRLRDAEALREVLARVGAELVLHGHRHRTVLAHTPGPEAEIPVVGARSASDVGEKESKRAQYHLYGIERREGATDGSRYRIVLRVRGWHVSSRSFRAEEERVLA